MAVTQISQIQVRYGLQEDIGTLAAGEFAWAIDTQRLFIGNGRLEEGAPRTGLTEVLTDSFKTTDLGPYIFRGILGGYEVITGVDAASYIVRLLQDKVDDFINVRDFGVSSTGNTDQTLTLQRALDQVYDRKNPVTSQRTRRILRFNAGTYRIDGEVKIPPYATLLGEGMENVKIILNGPAARLVTSTGADASNEAALGQYPRSVFIKGLTIQQTNDDDCIVLDGSTNVVFEDVALLGPRVRPETLGSGSCVVLRSTVQDTVGVHFHRCHFGGLGRAAIIESTEKIQNINFSECRFFDLYDGVRADDLGGTVQSVKISDSVFTDLYGPAVYGSSGSSGIISTGNTFINCASRYEGDLIPSNNWQPIIVFQSDGNYSFMDIFARTPAASYQYPRVSSQTYKCGYMSLDDYLGLGSAHYYSGLSVIITDGSLFNIPTVVVKHGTINYSMERDTMTRNGVINFTSKSTDVVWSEDYTESDDIGIMLNLSKNNTTGKIEINGTSSAIGLNTNFSFDIKNLA